MEESYIVTEAIIQDNGKMELHMAKANMSIKMVHIMMDFGKTIYNTEKEKSFGQMAQYIKEISTKAIKKEKEFLLGKMELNMTDSFKII